MNLSKIAVRFDNLTEREQIIEKFRTNGFKIDPNYYSTTGIIGYSEMCNYVCSLTEIGLQGKKFITYKEFTMKNLDINKSYKDSYIEIIRSNITSVNIRNPNYSTDVSKLRFYISDTDLSVDEANAVIKAFNLNYELIGDIPVDWSTIPIGTPVTITKQLKSDSPIVLHASKINNACNFHSYIKDLKSIIVLNTISNKVEVYNESEVSLCN